LLQLYKKVKNPDFFLSAWIRTESIFQLTCLINVQKILFKHYRKTIRRKCERYVWSKGKRKLLKEKHPDPTAITFKDPTGSGTQVRVQDKEQ
jgi:hypothetical protein